MQLQMSRKASVLLPQSCSSQLHFLFIMCCAPASKGWASRNANDSSSESAFIQLNELYVYANL